MIKVHIALVPIVWAFGVAIYYGTPLLGLNNEELQSDFLTYTLILVFSMPLSGFLSIYPDSIVKAHHDTVSTMKAGLWSTGANVVLNSLFVFVFEWGIAGIAFATVLSRYASFIYASLRARALELQRRVPEWDQGASDWPRGPLADIVALALPGTLTYALVLCEEAVIIKLLTASGGAAAQAAARRA